MRNLPEVNTVVDDSNHSTDSIDLKHWQSKANSEDLYALYSGAVANVTHYKFHDLLFTVHYKDKSARFFRHAILSNLRELVDGTVSIEGIREQARIVGLSEEQAKAEVKIIVGNLIINRARNNNE